MPPAHLDFCTMKNSLTPAADMRLALLRTILLAVLLIVFLHGAAEPAIAQLPTTQLNAIFPAGGAPATTVKATITGDHLDDVDRLVFSHPGITAKPVLVSSGKAEGEAETVSSEYEISIAADVPIGIHDIRAIGRYGVSNPRAFVVESLKQIVVPQDSPNDANRSVDKAMRLDIGSVASGRVTKNRADFYRFTAKKGEALIARCAGTGIDSRIDATLVLYDSAGKELMRVRDTQSYDPVMAFRIPADGDYIIEVYDFLYRGGDEYYYRLALTRRPYVESIFPPTGVPGESAEFTLYGYHLPGGKPLSPVTPSTVTGVASALEKVTVRVDLTAGDKKIDDRSLTSYVSSPGSMLDGQPYVLTSPQGDAGAITIGHAAATVVVEAEPNNQADEAQNVSLPCDFAGQFQAVGDEDWVAFTATAGERIWIDVISHRAGGNTDPTIVVEEITKKDDGTDQVKKLTTLDDMKVYVNRVPSFETRSRDPAFEFVAKRDATYRVMIRDVYNMTRGDPRLSYRMVIGRGEPDFRLVAHSDPYRTNNTGDLRMPSPVLRQGGTTAMNVHVFRHFGFDGDIHITAEGLPEGVTCRGAVAAGSAKGAKLIFEVNDDAPASAAAIRIVGTATADGQTIVREARPAHLMFDTENTERMPPTSRLVRQLWLSVSDKEQAPASIHVESDKIFETSLGGQLALPFQVTRRGDFKSDLRVIPEGLPRRLRFDPLRVSGDKKAYDLKIKTNDFPPGTYTFYLLGSGSFPNKKIATDKDKDKADADDEKMKDKNIRFSVASAPLRIRVHATPVNMIVPNTDHTIQPGATLSLPIPIERRFGFGGPVTLELRAPKGITAKRQAVAKDKTEIALSVQVAESVAPGEYECEIVGQHVFGGLALAAKQSFTLTVLPPTKADTSVAGN